MVRDPPAQPAPHDGATPGDGQWQRSGSGWQMEALEEMGCQVGEQAKKGHALERLSGQHVPDHLVCADLPVVREERQGLARLPRTPKEPEPAENPETQG